MHVYEVGKPYIPGTTRYQERVDYNVRSSAHELCLFLARLTSKERMMPTEEVLQHAHA
jgi:hypothetical protein